jgi:2'-5' RNA ligase
MTQYEIEFRFRDDGLSKVKQLIYHIEAKFHLDFFKINHPIPHVALAGPFTTTDEKKLVTDFVTLCSKTPFCSFEINTYAVSDANRVVCIRVDPGADLVAFRKNLLQVISPYCSLQKRDTEEPFVFHATIAKHVNLQKYNLIKKHAEEIKPQQFRNYVIRVTLIKEQKFLCEYDFLTRDVLTQKEALDKKHEFTDRSLYLKFINKKFNPDDRMHEMPPIPDAIFARPIWTKITDSLKKTR